MFPLSQTSNGVKNFIQAENKVPKAADAMFPLIPKSYR